MEPIIDAIARELNAGNRAAAESILERNTDHARTHERTRIVAVVASFRGTELPCDGPNPPGAARVMRETSEYVVNAIIARVERPDAPAESPAPEGA